MTESTHVYTLTLPGNPAVVVPLRGGSIALHSNVTPHVSADLAIPLPTAQVLGLIDPRQAKRAIISVEQTTGLGKIRRSFNLGIRGRRISHRAGTCTLTLASDEALLQDYAPLADDISLYGYAYQSSIRALTNYVLGKAMPGTVLAAGTQDPPIWAVIDSTNLVANPRARLDLTGWTAPAGVSIARVGAGGPSYASSYINVQAASASQLFAQFNGVPIQPGVTYAISLDQNADQLTPIGFDGVIRDSDGVVIADLPDNTTNAPAGWYRWAVYFTAPPNAETLDVRSFTTGQVAAGRSLNTTALRVSERTDDWTDAGPLDGSMPATALYSYSYSGDTSVRTALLERAADLLTWRAGVSALDFIVPILRMLGLRLVCDENRVWTLRDLAYSAGGSLSIRHGINLIDADDEMDRSGDLICDAAVVRYRWRDSTGAERQAIDKYSITAAPTKVRTIERDTPYPGPGFAQNVVRMAQMRGRTVSARAVSSWSVRADQDTEFTLAGSPVQVGRVDEVTFDLDTDEMTVTSRTTETLAGAITFLPGVIDNLPGVIDAL